MGKYSWLAAPPRNSKSQANELPQFWKKTTGWFSWWLPVQSLARLQKMRKKEKNFIPINFVRCAVEIKDWKHLANSLKMFLHTIQLTFLLLQEMYEKIVFLLRIYNAKDHKDTHPLSSIDFVSVWVDPRYHKTLCWKLSLIH